MAYPSDLKYTKDHEWVRLTGDTAEVGITAGSAFGTIESVKAVSELFAPVSGEIVAINERLAQAPEDVNVRPHDTWMVRIRVAGAAPDGLLDSAQYEALLS